jgi:hypothetical protein
MESPQALEMTAVETHDTHRVRRTRTVDEEITLMGDGAFDRTTT